MQTRERARENTEEQVWGGEREGGEKRKGDKDRNKGGKRKSKTK